MERQLSQRVLWIWPCSSVSPSVCKVVLSGLAYYFFQFFAWIWSSVNTEKCWSLYFWGKSLLCSKSFDSKQYLWTFCELNLDYFIKIFWNCLTKGIKKQVKVTVLIFQVMFLLYQEWGKWGIFEPKMDFFEHFSILGLYIFSEIIPNNSHQWMGKNGCYRFLRKKVCPK